LEDEEQMTKGEFAQTLREAAEVLSALADVVEERMGDNDIDAVMANAAIALQAALPGTPIC
jgi:predicted aconitase